MAQFNNRQQLIKASDEEIQKFFEETVFEGVFSQENKSKKHPDYYKGCITDIRLEGKPTNIVGSFLNVPKTSNPIPEGPCFFQCRMNVDSFRKEPNKYFVNFKCSSLRSKNSLVASKQTNGDNREQELFGMWGVDNCECIGFYHFDVTKKSYIVDDLRKPNFDRILYYPGDKDQCAISLSYPYEEGKIVPDTYYLFTWKLSHRNLSNPYEIELAPNIQPRFIKPKWFIDILFNDRHDDKSKNFGSAKNFLDTLSKQLSAKESTFVYELLQNANDYPKEGVPVDVEFHITDKYLLFMHSGDFFNVRNISGICGINEKEKSANKKTIGYKGIGFKTVFLNNHYVYIQTGDYSFRFDEGETPEKRIGGKIKRLGAPFPILPIWTPKNEVPNEVSSVFNAADEKFRVKIALRPDDTSILHSGRKNYESLFKNIFEDSNLILFIPNIRSVKVFIQGQLVRDCFIDENKWLVSDYEEDIDEDLQNLVNKDIDTGKSRIPEKYKDFDRTKVSFACRKDGRKLLPIENAHLYCYLPTSASWNFPFLLNTDMIPKGDRDDIEREVYLKDEDETNFNFELSRIAGEKFFCWIQDLVKSGKYDYDSIFSLIPDFDKCKKEADEKYAEFIENFKVGFEKKLQDADIIPVLVDREIVIKPVSKIIYDTTGLSCSGIMADNKMLSMSNWKDYFPHPLLRNYDKVALSPGIKSFLAIYRDDKQVYDKDTLHNAVEKDEFQEWLEIPENNEKFLGFLLKKGIVDYFSDSPIFLAENGGLYKPGELYYNIDDYYEDISSLDSYLCRLSLHTREFCEKYKGWTDTDFKENFMSFDPDDFVDDVLLDPANEIDVHKLLADTEASVHFMRFLSQHVGFDESYKRFPFVDSNGNIVENFTEPALVFTPSKDAESLRREKWIDSEWIAIISSAYDEVSQKYFFDHFGVQQYEDKIVIENIIYANEYQNDINTHLDSFEVSKSFVDFTFKNREYVNDGALSGYVVSALDKQGKENLIAADNYYIYVRNKIYNEIESQDWFDNELMYSLNESYYKGSGDTAEFKKFFEDKFGIPTITEKLLLEDIILKNASLVNSCIKDNANNISFWRWVKAFAKDQVTIQKFNIFNILVKELNENEYSVSTIKSTGIYLSNAYQSSSDIETIVRKYAPNALFVASDYLEDSTSSTIKEWVEFLSVLGVKITIAELVFSKIIPNVGEIKEEGLPILLGQYYAQIQERWDEYIENKRTVKSNLKSICVKTRNGAFTPIKDCIIVDVAKNKEPFCAIELGNEIAESISFDRNAKKLLLDISKETGGNVISDVTTWQERKLSEYAGNEDKYSFDIHVQFVEELSHIDIETLKTFESRKSLRLLDVNDEYQVPSKLTLSAAYKTSCQFDKYGVTEGLNFISRRYVGVNEDGCFVEVAKKVLNIHYRFEKEDISFLSNFKFTVYFWSEYALKHLGFVEELIEDGVFKNKKCIPTLAGNVYAPEDVYSPKLKDYVVKKIPGWEDKVLSDQIPEFEDENKDLISKLELKQQLSFKDGLNALKTIKSKEKRHDILEWMNKDYNDTYKDLVSEYRSQEDSVWKNGKAEDKHISELYAIAPDSKTLHECFRDNEFVLNSDYISLWNSEDYRSICNMMKIPIIEESEMEFNPVGEIDSNANYFEGRLLIVAGIENPDNWQTKFSEYKKKIGTMSFRRCSTISWTYKKNDRISQSNKKFYADGGSFYYVKDWCAKQVYTDFVRELYEFLSCEMNEDHFSTILDPDEDVHDIWEDHYSIHTDEFITELAKYYKEYVQYSGPKVSDEVEEADDTIGPSAPDCPPRKVDNYTQEDEVDNNSSTPDESTEKNGDNGKTANIRPNADNQFEDAQQEKTQIGQVAQQLLQEQSNDKNALLNQEPESAPEDEKFYEFDPDGGQPIGDISNDRNYDPLGSRPIQPHKGRKAAKPFTTEEIIRLCSNGTPLELESLSPTSEELDLLSRCDISPEQIADTNYLAQLRLYRNLQSELGEEPEESLSEFVRNANDVSEHKLKSGKYIHACSAARGVMYVSPSVWNKMVDDKWIICVYLDGHGNNFHYINTPDEFLNLVQKDDVVIKITGKEKVEVVNNLYGGILKNVKGTAYTLVRVAARTNMDAVFAHYVGSMAESNDGNDIENIDEY